MHIQIYISFIIYYIYIITTIIDSMYAPASNLRTIFYFIIYIMYLCVFHHAFHQNKFILYIKIFSIKHYVHPCALVAVRRESTLFTTKFMLFMYLYLISKVSVHPRALIYLCIKII